MASVFIELLQPYLVHIVVSASSVEIVIIMFLLVSHCWTLELYFLLTHILSCACSCSLKTLEACNCCVVGLYNSDLQLI